MGAQHLRPAYLSGANVYFRAMVEADKDRAGAWLDERFPANASRAEKDLEEEHRATWRRAERRLAIARIVDEEVVGSVQVVSWDHRRTGSLRFEMAPWREDADVLRAEALGLLVRWLRDELELMVVEVEVPADQPATIAAAEAAGMVRQGTLREWFARRGGRVDCLVYEALNPRWEVRDA
jgi:RimJ/RimL family protein N-acetyltransferase